MLGTVIRSIVFRALMALVLSMAMCVSVRAQDETPISLPTVADILPQENEILLVGVVASIDTTAEQFVLHTKSYQFPGQSVSVLDNFRDRTISYHGLSDEMIAVVKAGQWLSVAGPHQTNGALLSARAIVSAPEIVDTPPASTGAKTSPSLSDDPSEKQIRIVGHVLSVEPNSHSVRILAETIQLPNAEPITLIPARLKQVVASPGATIQMNAVTVATLETLRNQGTISVTGTDMGMGRPVFATDIRQSGDLETPNKSVYKMPVLEPPPSKVNLTIEDLLDPWLQNAEAVYPNTMAIHEIDRTAGDRPVICVAITPQNQDIQPQRRLVVLCRQHGDEPETTRAGAMAIYRLLTTVDAPTLEALHRCAVYIIPVANPDGAAMLHRTNDLGQDLNRKWNAPPSREIQALRTYINDLQPDLVLDVHQWVPGDDCQTPMVEACGGSRAAQLARSIHAACATVGYSVSVHNGRESDTSLCHRYYGRAQRIPAILFETQHISNNVAAQNRVVNAVYTGILGAIQELGQSETPGLLSIDCLKERRTEPLSQVKAKQQNRK